MSRANPDRYDIVVAGGGPAGIAAALSAARLGAHTLLLERRELLGGNASNANVHTICGLYLPAAQGDAVDAHAGLARRAAEALRREGAAGAPERAGRVWVLPTDPPRMADAFTRWCRETPNLEVRLECELIGVKFSESGALLRLGSGRTRYVTAPLLVDTSGDATAAALAAADVEEAAPDELQLPSFIFRMRGVDTSEIEGFGRLRLSHAVASAARSGELSGGLESVLVRRAAEPGEVYVTLNVPRPRRYPYKPLDSLEVARLQGASTADAYRLADFLRQTRPAFAASEIAEFPRCLGVRETRRVVGRVRLEREDVLEGRRRDDEVAVSSWPIELWHDHRRPSFEYPEAPCSIPLDALVSRTQPQIAAAGRCLSASHEALGALRVIATALASGEAAGIAAALAADAGSDLAAVAAAEVRKRVEELASRELPG